MRMIDLITKKRDGLSLTKNEWQYFVEAYTADQIPDYQASALLMAAFINGIDSEETTYLTHAMAFSGATLDLTTIPGIVVDKHSTGGVGDKTTLVLAPLIASAGVSLAKMSGRGLGHTGGTIDKLESFPGFNANLTMQKFLSLVKENRIALIGQTKNLAPADGKLYALRDVTGTVEALPLIASSIMSKKIASGAQAMVLDVKVGSGAFMTDLEEATQLGHLMVNIGSQLKRETAAVLSNMDQPLGYAVGNILEVKEAIHTLKGQGPEDLKELTLILGANMLKLANRVDSFHQGKNLLQEQIRSGKAINKLKQWIQSQGGDSSPVENPQLFPSAGYRFEYKAEQEGTIYRLDAKFIGEGCVQLGAGRETKEDAIDHSVGITLAKKCGAYVSKGETIAVIDYNEQEKLDRAKKCLDKAVTIKSIEDLTPKNFIYGLISKNTKNGKLDPFE